MYIAVIYSDCSKMETQIGAMKLSPVVHRFPHCYHFRCAQYTDEWTLSGDVKYHLGASTDQLIGDQNVHISLLPNPSHLETVNTVVIGKAR